MSKTRHLAALAACLIVSIGIAAAANAAQPEQLSVTSRVEQTEPTNGPTNGLKLQSALVCDEAVPAQYGAVIVPADTVVQFGQFHALSPSGTPIMRASSPTITTDSRTPASEIILTTYVTPRQANLDSEVITMPQIDLVQVGAISFGIASS